MADATKERTDDRAAGLGRHLHAVRRALLQVLRSPRLRRMALAFLVFNAVETGVWVVVLLYAYGATGPASVGLVALAQLLPAAFAAPLVATIGDGRSRDRLLLAGYAAFTLTLALVAVAMLSGWPPLIVYAAAVAATVALVPIRPAHHALLPEMSDTPQELTAANAVTAMAEAVGTLAGPLAVAAVLVISTHGVAIAVCAVALVAVTLVVLPLSVTPSAARAAAGATVGPATALARCRREVGDGFAALSGHRSARLLVLLLGARALMVGIADVLFVLLALELFATGESGAAALAAALGAGGILGGGAAFLLAGQPSIAWVIAGAAFGWGVALAVLAVPGIGPLAPLVMIAGGAGLAVLDIACRTFLQRAVPFGVLARVFGIIEGLSMTALALGSALVSLVVALFGLDASVVLFAILLPAIVLAAWPALRSLDARTLVPQREIALLRQNQLFEALPPPALERLARAARWRRLAAGQRVLREGDPGDEYYVLESGAVVATRDERFLRRMATRGVGFGEIALLRDVPRTASVTVERDVALLVLERDEFLAALSGDAGAATTAEWVTAARLLDRECDRPPA